MIDNRLKPTNLPQAKGELIEQWREVCQRLDNPAGTGDRVDALQELRRLESRALRLIVIEHEPSTKPERNR